jgi:hypothetical protein
VPDLLASLVEQHIVGDDLISHARPGLTQIEKAPQPLRTCASQVGSGSDGNWWGCLTVMVQGPMAWTSKI